jgi:hypothetical protein
MVSTGDRLTNEADIQKALFQQKDIGENVKELIVDWLQETMTGGQTILHPSPDYKKHIIEVH